MKFMIKLYVYVSYGKSCFLHVQEKLIREKPLHCGIQLRGVYHWIIYNFFSNISCNMSIRQLLKTTF